MCRVGGTDSMPLSAIHIETILIKSVEQIGNNRRYQVVGRRSMGSLVVAGT
jgi:hypothetical protein